MTKSTKERHVHLHQIPDWPVSPCSVTCMRDANGRDAVPTRFHLNNGVSDGVSLIYLDIFPCLPNSGND